MLGEQRQHLARGLKGIAVSPDGKMAAISDGSQRTALWDTKTWNVRTRVPGIVIGFGNSSSLTTLTADEVLRWDLSTGVPVRLSGQKLKHGELLASSADGKVLACRSENWGTIILWDLSGPEPKHRGAVGSLRQSYHFALSPEGKTLAASGAKGQVRLFDLTNAEPREKAVLEGNYEWGGALAFSADGKTLAPLGKDNAIRLWDLSVPKPRERGSLLKGKYPYGLGVFAFSPNGKTLLALDDPGVVIHAMRKQSEARVTRRTVEELDELGGRRSVAAATYKYDAYPGRR